MPFYNTKLILQITEQFALITEDYSILKKQLMKCESEQSQMTSKDKVSAKTRAKINLFTEPYWGDFSK